jgi:hypothetical protein
MSEQRDHSNIKIIRRDSGVGELTPMTQDSGAPHITVVGHTKPVDEAELAGIPTTSVSKPTPAVDTLDAFELRVSETYWRLMGVFEHKEESDEDEFVDINLNRELAPRLWGAILHDGLDGCAGSRKDFEATLHGKRTLRLTWELDEADDDKLWAVVSADGEEIARGEFEHFHDEKRWIAASLRWLIQQLGVDDPALGKTVRQAIPRR